MKRYLGKIDLFAPSFGDKEAIITCNFNFDLNKKNLKKKIAHLHLLQKKCGGQPNNYYYYYYYYYFWPYPYG